MNRERIEQFVHRYLDATGCQIIEKGEGHTTVRLSPEADKDLMNRSYYWSFVERTGAPPEPMNFMFIFDPESRAKQAPVAVGVPRPAAPAAPPPGAPGAPGAPAAQGAMTPQQQAAQQAASPGGAPDSILGRYFGFVPNAPVARIPNDVMTFGSRRLDQLFGVVQSRGRFVRLFEEPKPEQRNPFASIGYSSWLCINYKVEFICDMKRDEIHSFGIHLGTGQIMDRFFDRVKRRNLSPKLPANIHLQPVTLKLDAAVEALENQLETLIKGYDLKWSEEAWKRLVEEWDRIDTYYGELLMTIDPEKKAEVEEQYKSRGEELDWQYRPRIVVSVINCGFFHLAEGLRTAIDANR